MMILPIFYLKSKKNKSSDSYHKILVQRYSVLEDQIRSLSNLVEYQLRDYDKVIHQSFAVVFDACDFNCWSSSWSGCYGIASPATLTCMWSCVLGCLIFGPLYTACLTPCFITCAVGDVAWAVFCAVVAIFSCSCDSGGGGGGGGCPILSVYNGTEFISEGVLDIHAHGDVIRTLFLHTTPSSTNHRYRLRLTERSQNISHIDNVRLLARIDNGRLIEFQLVSAFHSTDGNVLMEVKHSDDIRIDTIGSAENDGISQYIELEFTTNCNHGFRVRGTKILQFIFVIEGFNAKEP